MAIVTLPTFAAKEIVTAEKMNALVAALNSKFAGGFDSADLQWPLEAGGDLAMGTHAITGASQIMKVVNAASYASLQAAITAAGAGGCVFVPPDTTITESNVSVVNAGVTIIGAGPSSVIMLPTAATAGYLLKSAATGQEGLVIANLTLDGNETTAAAQTGLYLEYVSNVYIRNVIFKDFNGMALSLSSGGADGNACSRVWITDCQFSDGTSHHIFGDDVADLTIRNCIFTDCAADTIHLHADATNKLMQRVRVLNNTITGSVGSAIYAAGGNATSTEKWADVDIIGNTVTMDSGATVPAIVAGISAGMLRRTSVSDNQASAAPAGGISVCSTNGRVSNNNAYSVTGTAINIGISNAVAVSGNDARTATVCGLDAHDSVDCTANNNALTGSVPLLASASLAQWDNIGVNGMLPEVGYINRTPVILTEVTTGSGNTITVPAHTFKVGELVKIRSVVEVEGDTDSFNLYLRVKCGTDTITTLAQIGMESSVVTHLRTVDLQAHFISAISIGVSYTLYEDTHVELSDYYAPIAVRTNTPMVFDAYCSGIDDSSVTPVIVTLRSLEIHRCGTLEVQT
jgi:hypothetical protein